MKAARMRKHTAGPWIWDEKRTKLVGKRGSLVLLDGEGIWDLCSSIALIEDKPKEAEANARLIAAAPDLLEALMCFVDNEQFRLTERQRLDKALAAIAKATEEKS